MLYFYDNDDDFKIKNHLFSLPDINVEANRIYYTEISYPSDIEKQKIIFSWSFWSNNISDDPVMIFNRYSFFNNAIVTINHKWSVNQIVKLKINSIYVNYSVR